MKIAIHQPYYLPWAGYFHKMSVVDRFVILDDVQYVKNAHFNRTKILMNGKPRWLTVPAKGSRNNTIMDVQIDNNQWVKKHAETIKQNYARMPRGDVVEKIADWFFYEGVCSWQLPMRLASVDMWSINILAHHCDITTPRILASHIDYEPATKTQRLINICKVLGADTYVAGSGGSKEYIDLEMFRSARINVEWQEFEYAPYEQPGVKDFVSGMSMIDTLAAMGPIRTMEYIKRCGKLEEAI